MSEWKEVTTRRNKWWLAPWRALFGERGGGESDTNGADDTPSSPAHTSDMTRWTSRGRVGSDESETQFRTERRTDDVIDLVMGFDFGTSCSKVVVRSPFMLRSRAVVVPWRGRDGASTCLLPTVLYESRRGELDLVSLKDGDVRHTDIKTKLLGSLSDDDARARAAAYLGRALRKARRWLLDTQQETWGRYRIRWALNVGIPSAGYDDDKKMRETFLGVARAAWRLSLQQAPPTKAMAIAALFSDRESNDIGDPVIEVVPEIVAEFVGYARSRRRRDGLHVIVDVGASTIDICGFILHAPDGDRYELLTALVNQIGVNELHLCRLRAIEEAGRSPSTEMTSLDPLGAIPDVGRDYFPHPADPLCEKLDEIDADYEKKCKNALMQVLMTLKKSRYPTWFTTASKPLFVFMAGGGRSFARIRQAMEKANNRFQQSVYARGINLREIPLVETANEFSEDMAGRLDVAYGLSFDKFDIGAITPPDEIEDILPRPPREPRQMISKDQV